MERKTRRNLRERFALKNSIVKEALAEFLGTFVLILFGCGSVAQTVLSRGAVGEMLTIHIGFTLGVTMAVYVAGGVSGHDWDSLKHCFPMAQAVLSRPACEAMLMGVAKLLQLHCGCNPKPFKPQGIFNEVGAHVNPAVSLAMLVLGKLKLVKFPVYVLAQFLGAFAGAAAVYGLYYDAFMDYTNGILIVTGPNATAHIFASYPGRHLSILNGFIDQVIGTGTLVLCILAIVDGKNNGAPKGMEPLVIGLIIMAIGVSMGLNCGYPINPARDLGPRLFTAVAGWGRDVFSAGSNWWWIPVSGPLVGGVVGAVLYLLFIELHHAEPQKHLEEENSVKEKYEMIMS
ncbi:AQP10 protein, partial [Atractosteus spatula]|nr:AQP10 protein [Atractosteus spatula]